MNQFFACTVAVLFTALLSGAEPDWFQFRGPHRDGLSLSTGLLKEWPEGGPAISWQATGAGRGYASVVIAGEQIFTIGDGPSTADDDDAYLVCFDRKTGEQQWKSRIGDPWKEGPSNWQSSRSTPTVDGDRVYALTAHGDLVCCKTEDGTEVWRKNLKADFGGKKGDSWGYSESVLIDGDRLICTPGGSKSTMVALDKSNGELIWTAVRDGDRGAGHASIVISEVGGVRVYVQTTASGALGVRAKDGELMWSYEIDRTTAVIPTPIVRNDLAFFTAGYGRGGALLKQVPDGEQVTIEEIYPLRKNLENKHGGVILVGEHLYGDSGDSGIPFCAEFKSGENVWKKRGGKGSMSLTAAEGHLYLLFSGDPKIVLAKASPEQYEVISSFELESESERPAWAHPVVHDGYLYIRHDDQIFRFDVKANRS